MRIDFDKLSGYAFNAATLAGGVFLGSVICNAGNPINFSALLFKNRENWSYGLAFATAGTIALNISSIVKEIFKYFHWDDYNPYLFFGTPVVSIISVAGLVYAGSKGNQLAAHLYLTLAVTLAGSMILMVHLLL